MMVIEEPTEKEIEERLLEDGFKWIGGDINFLTYGGLFANQVDEETFYIIEILGTEHYFRDYPKKYIVTLSRVWIDDDEEFLNGALRACGYSNPNPTVYQKLDAIYHYWGGDQITSIDGDDIIKMLDWTVRAFHSWPWIETYEE